MSPDSVYHLETALTFSWFLLIYLAQICHLAVSTYRSSYFPKEFLFFGGDCLFVYSVVHQIFGVSDNGHCLPLQACSSPRYSPGFPNRFSSDMVRIFLSSCLLWTGTLVRRCPSSHVAPSSEQGDTGCELTGPDESWRKPGCTVVTRTGPGHHGSSLSPLRQKEPWMSVSQCWPERNRRGWWGGAEWTEFWAEGQGNEAE